MPHMIVSSTMRPKRSIFSSSPAAAKARLKSTEHWPTSPWITTRAPLAGILRKQHPRHVNEALLI